MRILHTADFHLRERGDPRWEALRAVVELGRSQGVDAMVVAGDLFDAEADAEGLRPHIREPFSGNGFPIFLLPGNHDAHAYGDRAFGEDTRVLRESEPVDLGEAVLVGLPFADAEGEQVARRLRRTLAAAPVGKPRLLVYHGELLDAVPHGGERDAFGREGDHRYMPVKLSYFQALEVECVLAGHFHSRFSTWSLPEGGHFVYSGSPVSITRRETGRRAVHVFEPGQLPSSHPLDTPHYQEVTVTLDPFEEEDAVERIRAALARAHEAARVLLTVDGYVNAEALGTTERELAERIREAAADCEAARLEFSDVSRVVEHELFAAFRRALSEREGPEESEGELTELAIRAMMEAGL